MTRRIVHRDLKPENRVVDSATSGHGATPRTTMQRAAELATRLNDQSTRLRDALLAIEHDLNALNAGVEARVNVPDGELAWFRMAKRWGIVLLREGEWVSLENLPRRDAVKVAHAVGALLEELVRVLTAEHNLVKAGVDTLQGVELALRQTKEGRP